MLNVLLVVAKNIEAGGVEAYLLNVLKQVNRKNLVIDILVPGVIVSQKTAEKFLNIGCKFHVLNLRSTGILRDLGLWHGMRKVLLSKTYDIVHINTANLRVEAVGLALAKKRNVEIRIAHSHGTLLYESIAKEYLRNILRNVIYNSANIFLACSRTAAESLVGKRNSKDVVLAKNGINAADYKFNEKVRGKIRAQYGWFDHFVIGFIARISSEKNHLFMLRVMKQIIEMDKRSLLVIVGNGDTICEKRILEEVENLNLQNHVQFLGEKYNINELVQGMDLHVLPSIREALGIVNIEAQASGLHCICSDRVPSEADVTGLVEFIPLEKDADYWAKRIMSYDNGYERQDTEERIIESGYDISSSAKIISKLYDTIDNKEL